MKQRQWLEDVPTVMISAETGSSYIEQAFELGAADCINRPFSATVVRRRIINTILLHTRRQEMMDILTSRVYRQEKSSEVMLSILSFAVEYRNGEGGSHMSGVEYLTGLLLRRLLAVTEQYSLAPEDVDLICTASALHDIGKLLVPEDILQKPGKLTGEEFAIIKTHTKLGAQILSELPMHRNEKLVKYAIEICRWHHERWNGEGYPDGLSGDHTPIAAQVVSLADAYDALTSKRSYKQAFSHEKAIEMIHNGECGSYNPLLLRCLDDVSDTAKQGMKNAGQTVAPLRRVVEDLYKGQDLTAARMTQQLEDAYAKQDFFTSLSDELWFDYTAQPSSLHLSRGLAEQTGLPSVMLEPLQSPTLQMYLGKELTEGLKRQLEGLTLEETRLHLTTKLRLRGRLRRCQLSVQITWSARKQKRCAALLGKVTNIENRSQCIEQLRAEIQHAETPQTLPQPPLPISASNGVIRITHNQLGHLFHTYQPLFETVRLVDPGICMQVTPGPDGPSVRENDYCYAMWCKKQRCERCISQDAVRTRQIQNKVESIGKDMYYIIAVCIEVDGTPYSLECMNPIRLDSGPGGQEEYLLNQLLMRNRQVYMDSATQVFNRRYYDEQLRELSGEYAVAMIDVDNFKQVNDRFGHAAGDAALYRVAQTMRSLLRSSDALVRYGGAEFFLLFQSLPRAVLHQKLEVLCCAVRELKLPEFPELHLTISVGGVHGQGRVRDLILQADTALYEAKIKKDCVVVMPMKLNEFYVAVDGNYEDAMERLQNEMFVGKFLRMLPRDSSMMLLEKAMADGRANDAFRAVHTLKGIALNLSLTKLAAACSQLTEALRGADTIPQQARELLIPVRQEYARIRDALEELDA